LREALELAPWFGIDISGHSAQQLDASMQGADLVLGFEQAHVRYAVVDAGIDRSRTFTLPDFVTVLDDVAPPAPADLVSAARDLVADAAARRDAAGGRAIARDVPDPFGLSWKAQCRIASDIRQLVIRLVTSLFAVTVTTGLPPLPAELVQRPRSRSFWRGVLRS
jgi:protein-tyrosine-phosphatase